MAIRTKNKSENKRQKRKQSVRKTISGTNERPRLSVFKSNRYTYAQLISDESGQVVASSNTKALLELKGEPLDGKSFSASSKEMAKELGLDLAQKAKDKSVTTVVFDRNGYKYHGKIASVADGAREGGLVF